MLIGDTAEASLVDHFGHPCQAPLSYTASATDPAVTVSISETNLMTVAIGVVDSMPVRVMATDTADKFAVHVFYVSVEQPNRGPVATGSIPDQTVSPGRATETAVNVSGNFSDPDGDVLLFHDPPESADPTIAKASVTRNGDEFRVFGGPTLGQTTITITVSDPEGLTASHDVTVHNVPEDGG